MQMETSRFATRWSEIEEVACSLVQLVGAPADGHTRVTSQQGSDLDASALSKSRQLQEPGPQSHVLQPGSNRLVFMVSPQLTSHCSRGYSHILMHSPAEGTETRRSDPASPASIAGLGAYTAGRSHTRGRCEEEQH